MLTKFRVEGGINTGQGPLIKMRCPGCGHTGTFERITPDSNPSRTSMWFGQRRCPDPQCSTHIFYIHDGSKLTTFPPEVIDFKKDNIPVSIAATFEEALTCHANNCFVAAAIMIRKTLEVLAADRGAEGDNLKKRLKDLGTKILIPKELIDGMDELRLLGNDAAHIESNTFANIGAAEIEVSIEFTKELLKAVFQYEALLGKLRGLKKT
jgi:hypothetical protein